MKIKICNKVLSFKTALYPKFCDGCGKGINDGYTADDEMVKMCPTCFNKDEEWQNDLTTEWDKHEKNNDYEPRTYRTRWNFELYDEVGYDKYGKEYNLNPYNRDEYELENGD
tara:strand:- start:141 stop:476 length:336 start_codon:yes stop_codon:yes gene_type:complete